jgi:gluconate 2-dehydrogenase gamma chain
MDRREAIKRTAYLMGGVVFAPTIAGVLKGCTPSTEKWTPVLFNKAQAGLTETLAEIIIPATDTPGAVDVGVPGFIENMVKDIYTAEQRSDFIEGLNQFDVICQRETGHSFVDLDDQAKLAFATERNRLAIENEYTEGPQFFLIFKELTMVGYFTSEVGASQVLRYEPIPGYYDGCVPFEEIGKTWATA